MSNKSVQINELRTRMQRIMRGFSPNSYQTACGVNVSPSFAHILLTINKLNDVIINQQILAKEMSLNKSTITRLCSDLEQQEFIKVGILNEDKRNKVIQLTTRGKKLAEKLKVQGDIFFENIIQEIPVNKIEKVLESLAILTDALDSSTNHGDKNE